MILWQHTHKSVHFDSDANFCARSLYLFQTARHAKLDGPHGLWERLTIHASHINKICFEHFNFVLENFGGRFTLSFRPENPFMEENCLHAFVPKMCDNVYCCYSESIIKI